jgi:putative phosphoribosyl transferase
MSFKVKNRQHAALRLVKELEIYKDTNAIVLAIPRGGIPIGYYIAQELRVPLEIILSKKIGYPNNPEFAIGSVTLQGVVVDEKFSTEFKDYIDIESKKILEALKSKFALYMGNRKPADLINKTVIIVDDGIATGNTIMATIQAVKKSNPKKIIVAVPVAPKDTATKIEKLVDDFICLHVADEFFGVGQFYEDFSQVSDEEVIHLLNKNRVVNILN